MGLLIEFVRDYNRTESVRTWAGFFDLKFVPQERYCGHRALLIHDEAVSGDLLRTPGFRRYTGPIIEHIPEDAREVDWDDLILWLRAKPEAVRTAVRLALSDPAPAAEPDITPAPEPEPKPAAKKSHKKGGK